jgi:hypothetical protein
MGPRRRAGDVEAVHRLHPDEPRFRRLSDNDRLIVSEPFRPSRRLAGDPGGNGGHGAR